MPRIARVVVPDCVHHVTQRGNRQQAVFFSDTDRRLYLQLLQEHSGRHGLRMLGYCLMGNHVHLLVIPKRPDSLAKALGRTHNDYARWHNLRRQETGHLWQNRYYSCPLDETYIWEALRYVELNPVRAGLVRQAAAWPWSSASAHLTGIEQGMVLHWAPWRARWSPHTWAEALELGVADAAMVQRLRDATFTGRPAGSVAFVREVEARLKRPLRPRPRGRPARIAPHEQAKLGIM